FMIEHYADHHSAPVAPTAPAPATPVASAPATTVAAPTPPPAASASAESSTASRAFFRLMRGGFRAVSGLIGKADPNEYRIATPVATIGIRGTDYIVAICDAACARDPVLRAELPDGAGMQGGIVASVVDGRINVNSGGATLNTFPTGGSPFGWL